MKIKELQLGDYFTKNPTEHPRESQVWVRENTTGASGNTSAGSSATSTTPPS